MAKRSGEANAAIGAALFGRQPPEPSSPVAPPSRRAVREGWARSMVYLPEPAKRKIQEIAFHARRKENDVMLDAFREYLERQGFPGLL